MSIVEIIKNTYPELTDRDFAANGSIQIRDDADGLGSYIYKWEYEKPIPAGFKLGKD